MTIFIGRDDRISTEIHRQLSR